MGSLESIQQVAGAGEVPFDAPLLEQSHLARESQCTDVGGARLELVTDGACRLEGRGRQGGVQLRQRVRGSGPEQLDEPGVQINGSDAANLRDDSSIDLAQSVYSRHHVVSHELRFP